MDQNVQQQEKSLAKKLFWSWVPESQREAANAIVRNLLLHWFPAKVSRRSFSFSYSFWLGTISTALFLILTATGVILMFYYVPSVERAYQSIKDVIFIMPFGKWLRNLHRLGAHLMVILVFLHMVRVYLTGAYKNGRAAGSNRPVNWIVGVVLLLLTLGLSFTGYLLPWDQLAFWAVTVGTNIAQSVPVIGSGVQYLLLGGHEIGQNALIRFYVLHIVVLPGIIFMLVAYHLWRVRKDGGLAAVEQGEMETEEVPAEDGENKKTYTLMGITDGANINVQPKTVESGNRWLFSSPNLMRRIVLVMLLTFIVTGVLALFVQAPLEAPANPEVTPNPAKAPWYFLWLQELVTITTIHLGSFTVNGALIGGVLIPGILLLLLIAWPYLDDSPFEAVGVWFARSRRRQIVVFLLLVFAVVVLILIATYFRGPYWDWYWPGEPWPEQPIGI